MQIQFVRQTLSMHNSYELEKSTFGMTTFILQHRISQKKKKAKKI